jgi:hypothetical protein
MHIPVLKVLYQPLQKNSYFYVHAYMCTYLFSKIDNKKIVTKYDHALTMHFPKHCDPVA